MWGATPHETTLAGAVHYQMATFVAAPPLHKPQPGLVGNALRKQEVSNPGLRQQLAVAEVKRQRALKEEVSKLSAQVAALEGYCSDEHTDANFDAGP